MNEEEEQRTEIELRRIMSGAYQPSDNERNHRAFAASHLLLHEKLDALLDLLTEEDEDEDDA